jgi:hypothetical protein
MKLEATTAILMLVVIALLVFGEHYAKARGYTQITDRHDYMVSNDMAQYMSKHGHGLQFREEDIE